MTHTNLRSLFTDIADAIRAKTDSSTPIVADAFPSAIADIPTGGGGSEELDGLVMRTLTSFTGSQSEIGDCAFYSYPNLTTVSFPVCTSIGDFAFFSCSSLTNLSFPACTSIGSNAFGSCSSIITASFPVCKSIGQQAFRYCSNLTTASFPVCMNIEIQVFNSCAKLTELTIGTEYSSVCKLVASNAFNGCTALTSIYVPASLLTAYQSSTNWAYFSSKLVGV